MSEIKDRFCSVCHRDEKSAGRLFNLPNNISVCSDCMHNMLDSLEHLDLNSISVMDPSALFNVMRAGNAATQTPEKNEDRPLEDIPISSDTDGDTKVSIAEKPEESGSEEEKPAEEPKKSSGNQQTTGGFPNIQFLNLADLGMPFMQRQHIKRQEKSREKKEFDFKTIPHPHKIKEKLDEYVVGQEQAKKIVSVAVYNHYKRVEEDLNSDKYPEKDVEIEKSNILMLGPTGSGKTYLVQTLARILDVPLAITDATTLTEAGYIGDDIESVVSKLLAAADNDVERAEHGIIFIDEIDKIAKKRNANTRDVSGESVQQGMLKLLEGAEIEVPVGASSKNAMVPMATVDTRNILFICGGAFPDLDEIIKQRLNKETSIGFMAELKDRWDKERNILKKAEVEDIRKYGMIPEFIGRLPIICALEGLTEEMMVKILKEPKNAIIKQYKKLLSMDEVDLEFTEGALLAIAKKALEKETGARALRSIIEEFMLDIMYEVPKDDNIGRVIITEEYIEGKGGPIIDLRGVKELTGAIGAAGF
ncbi:MAG: ATP-dependent Clp protease ATP-binding subunit ClpX [Lachnospiraceae bacterium]|nr:ATP-dependent Clp protease ATP-binding subunit ClpX [Lachnospiraceae bacterium]